MSGARRVVRVGAIGAGWWATTNHYPLLAARDDVELVGVCSLGAEHLELVQRRFGFTHATQDYRALLDLDLDAVVVASPHHLHHEHAGAALDRGLTVLCEKPMALSAADAWDLVARADRAHAELLVGYGWNYKPFLQQAARLVRDSGLGEVEYVTCQMASPTKDFFSTPRATVPSQFVGELTGPDPATWQDATRGGGYAHGQLTHATGLLFWLTDLRARQASARMTGPNAPVDLYDAALVTFTNNAHGVLSGAATLPDDDKFQIDLRVFGTEGVLLIDVERERVELRRHDGRHRSIHVAAGAGAYSCEGPLDRFIELAAGTTTANDSPGHAAARSVELLEAMTRSALKLQGQPVSIDLSLGGADVSPRQGDSLSSSPTP